MSLFVCFLGFVFLGGGLVTRINKDPQWKQGEIGDWKTCAPGLDAPLTGPEASGVLSPWAALCSCVKWEPQGPFGRGEKVLAKESAL